MNQVTSTISADVCAAESVSRGAALWRIYLELGKARLSALVVVTAVVGYLVAARGFVEYGKLFWLGVGAALTAGCANALNQVMEVDRDRKMRRTAGRPIPSGRIGATHAAAAAVAAGGAGLTILAAATNMMTAGLAALTIAIYLLVYTPLKVRTAMNTLVGAVVGAIPPMMGWAAATGRVEIGAWALGALLFVWQVPHFLALAWMYREDYKRGGYKMLPGADETGGATFRAAVIWSAALIPVGLASLFVGVSGSWFALASLGLGLWVTCLALKLEYERTDGAARRLFLATVTYLPLLLAVMVLDAPTSGAPMAHSGTGVLVVENVGGE